MNVSMLTRYSNFAYPARSLFPAGNVKRAQTAPLPEAAQAAPENGGAVSRNMQTGQAAARQIKRVGYTGLDGSWDQFMLSRFVELVERSTGNALDAGAIMKKYDLDGDGLLSAEEQTALIEGLTKTELGRSDISRSITESVIEQLRGLSGLNEPKYATGLLKAARRYERLFLYENKETPEEAAAIAV